MVSGTLQVDWTEDSIAAANQVALLRLEHGAHIFPTLSLCSLEAMDRTSEFLPAVPTHFSNSLPETMLLSQKQGPHSRSQSIPAGRHFFRLYTDYGVYIYIYNSMQFLLGRAPLKLSI